MMLDKWSGLELGPLLLSSIMGIVKNMQLSSLPRHPMHPEIYTSNSAENGPNHESQEEQHLYIVVIFDSQTTWHSPQHVCLPGTSIDRGKALCLFEQKDLHYQIEREKARNS